LPAAVRALAESLSELGPTLRVLCLTLPALGVVLTVIGIGGDVAGWWDDYPYLTNFLSGLTGACFGVPFAIIILRRLTDQMEDRATERSAMKLVQRSGRDLLDAAEPLLTTDQHAYVAGCLQLHAFIGDVGDSLAVAAEAGPKQLREHASRLVATMDRGCRELDALLPSSAVDADAYWARLVDCWRFCNDHVKARALATNIEWLDPSTHAELQFSLYDRPNPFEPIYRFTIDVRTAVSGAVRDVSRDAGRLNHALATIRAVSPDWEDRLWAFTFGIDRLRAALAQAGGVLAADHPALPVLRGIDAPTKTSAAA
jgi:hypothetical protein